MFSLWPRPSEAQPTPTHRVRPLGMWMISAAASAFAALAITVNPSLASEGRTLLSEDGVEVTVGGEVEVEFVDVEGEGGFSNRDRTSLRVETRSPQIRIDKAVLEANLAYNSRLNYTIQLRFRDSKASVDRHYATLKFDKASTRVEIGKNRPIVSLSRRTEVYPLTGTAYWKGREYHLASKSQWSLTPRIHIDGVVSVAMKRPFGTDDVAEDKSFKMLVYSDHENRDGSTYEYGAMIRARTEAVFASGWYYTGSLIDDHDWKTSLSQSLPKYDDLGAENDRTHWWTGGRLGIDHGGVYGFAEFIRSQDGLLPRSGYAAQLSYRWSGPQWPFEYVEPLVGFSRLDIGDHPEVRGNSLTWDRELTSLALPRTLRLWHGEFWLC